MRVTRLKLLVPAAMLSVAVVIACSNDSRSPATGVVSAELLGRRGIKANWASQTSYDVQAVTTRGGQFWSNCTNSTTSYTSTTHQHDSIPGYPRVTHQDSVAFYNLDASCQAGSAYNGGWVNVYDVQDGNAKYVGQVQGNMISVTFWYEGTNYRTVRLDANPDVIHGCSFGGFDNYSPSTTSISVTGQGALPLAHFTC